MDSAKAESGVRIRSEASGASGLNVAMGDDQVHRAAKLREVQSSEELGLG